MSEVDFFYYTPNPTDFQEGEKQKKAVPGKGGESPLNQRRHRSHGLVNRFPLIPYLYLTLKNHIDPVRENLQPVDIPHDHSVVVTPRDPIMSSGPFIEVLCSSAGYPPVLIEHRRQQF